MMSDMSDSPVLRVNDHIVASALVAATWPARFRGALLRRELPEALWLSPERSVHGIGMRRALDVALVDAEGRVRATTVLRPWRATRPRRDVVAVLEAPVGSFERWGLTVGAVVHVGPRGAPQKR